MGFPKSTLYYQENVRKQPASAAVVEDARLTVLIRSIHQASHGTYGSLRVTAALREQGEVVNHKRVRRLMREAGIEGISRRRTGRSKAATRAAAEAQARVPADLVKRSFTATAPDTTWFADITEHPTQDGILYLASVLDAFDKTIVGWSMGDRATTELVVNAVEMAVSRRNPIIPPIHHSDRGAQPRFKGSLQRLPGSMIRDG